MRFAFLIMGDFDNKSDYAEIHGGDARIIGVRNVSEAAETARRLAAAGTDCIELCGAFGESGARAVIAATDGKIPVGFVTHLPEQDGLYASVFGE